MIAASSALAQHSASGNLRANSSLVRREKLSAV
jgi:hypothetical protein